MDNTEQNSEQDSLNPNLKPNRELPNVTAPESGFFIQLFFLPAMIVCGIALLWWVITAVVGTEKHPSEYIEILQSERGDRWKAASDLSLILKENSKWADDEQLAAEVCVVLQKMIDQSKEVKLSENKNLPQEFEKILEYVCGLCGQFNSTLSIPLLTETIDESYSSTIRRASLISIWRISDRIPDIQNEDLTEKISLLTNHTFENYSVNIELILDRLDHFFSQDELELKNLAISAAGEFNHPKAIKLVQSQLQSSETSIRFNAAISAAQLGIPESFPVFKEMLDQDNIRFTYQTEDGTELQDDNLVIASLANACKGLIKLHQSHPELAYSELVPYLEQLLQSDNPLLRVHAQEALNEIQK